MPDALGRYYTSALVGAHLVGALDVVSPKTVIDLACGPGALTRAAAAQWPHSRYLTVDCDPAIASARFQPRRARHHQGDALDLTLHEALGLALGEGDVAVCNPPYIRRRWRRSFACLLEDAGLSGVIPRLSEVGAETLFLAQNLRLLRQGGRLGLIVPDSFVSGEKTARLRRHLLRAHAVERIIELPVGIFRKTEAKAHIFVMSKATDAAAPVIVQQLRRSGTLSSAVFVEPDADASGNRLDYSYLSAMPVNSVRTLGEFVERIERGGVISTGVTRAEHPVFHTDAFVGRTVPTSFLRGRKALESAGLRFASVNDVLLARVDRRLEEKVALVSRRFVAVSDCVFVIRPRAGYSKFVFSFLTSAAGRQALRAASRGVGAKYLTKRSILSLPVR